MSATEITLDRERLLALMDEAYFVCAVLDTVSGVTPTRLTDDLTTRLEEIQVEVFGPIKCDDETGEVVGPHREMWERSDEAAGEYFRSLGTEAVAS